MGTVRKIMPADRENFAMRKHRRRHPIELELAVATMGEDVVIALMKAVRDDDETWLVQLPPSKRRDELIANFRERHAGERHAECETAEIVRLK